MDYAIADLPVADIDQLEALLQTLIMPVPPVSQP
jgi:hypothetical protein